MQVDKRVKGCPNETCKMHQDKIKQKADNDYCPKCGTPLIYVCEKCFKEIQDIDPKHRICAYCLAQKKEKMDNLKEKAKSYAAKGARGAIGIVTPIVAAVVAKEKKEIVDVIVDTIDKFKK